MTQTMRERLARAVALDLMKQDLIEITPAANPFPRGDMEWDYIDQGRVDFGQLADAILAELRFPDEAMIHAAGESPAEMCDACHITTAATVDRVLTGREISAAFTAMIDQARKLP